MILTDEELKILRKHHYSMSARHGYTSDEFLDFLPEFIDKILREA